jgi:hypothetical protein
LNTSLEAILCILVAEQEFATRGTGFANHFTAGC